MIEIKSKEKNNTYDTIDTKNNGVKNVKKEGSVGSPILNVRRVRVEFQ